LSGPAVRIRIGPRASGSLEDVMRVLLLPLACWLLSSSTAAQSVRISEFLTINDGVLADQFGDYSDWIELENTGAAAVDLTGWHLTDDDTLTTRWTFPATSIVAGGRLVVFASGLDLSGSELHTNFELSGNGEYLGLYLPGGAVVVDEYAPEYPDQFEDVSYGYGLDLSGSPAVGHFLTPTPGAPNGTVAEPVEPVTYGVERGFHDTPFSLTLACATPNVLIHYTLDGSEPDQTSTLYSTPIPVSTTTVVRARAYLIATLSISDSTTSTYLFADDVVNQSDAGAIAQGFPSNWIEMDGTDWSMGSGGSHPGASYGYDTTILAGYTTTQLTDSLKDIPTVSLVMSVDDWFGYNPPLGPFGIYVNSEQSGPDWDRKGSVEYIDPDGGPGFQINCGLAIQGGSSITESARSQLSIALKFQSEFGATKLEFPLFADTFVEEFDYLILDGGNQNSISSPGSTSYKKHAQGLRDQYMADLQRELGAESFHGDFVHVYINGLYWGMYNLHERPDERWAAELFGGEDEEHDWIKEGVVLEGNSNPASDPTAPGAWPIVNDITATGLGDAAVYGGRPAYEVLQDYMDLGKYVDYMNLNFYGGNTDWPHRNWMATGHARNSADYTDVNPDPEFELRSWDAEATLSWQGVTAVGDGFYDRTQVTGSNGSNAAYYYTNLQNHSEFALLFADHTHAALFNGGALYVDPAYATTGTIYDPAFPERNRPAAVYYDLAQRVEGAIPMEFARWANYFGSPGTITPTDWFTERDRLLNDYFPIRSGVLLAQLKNQGLYPNLEAPTFNQHGGQVPLGFSVTMSAPAGTIYYTTDGTDPRLPGGAIDPLASTWTGAPFPILALTTVKARAFDGSEWSALLEATFLIDLSLRIGELMADNATTIADEVGQFEDWLEIHNGSASPVDLGGMYLTDDLLNPTKWQIPAGTIAPAGGTVLVWADEDPLDGPLHADFKLSAGGESVGLFHTDVAGNVLIDGFDFGPQATDVAYGRMPDDGPFLFSLLDPSPGAPNVPAAGAMARFDATPTTQNPVSLAGAGVAGIGQTPLITYSGAAPGVSGVQALGVQTLQLPYGPANTILLLPASPALWSVFFTDPFGNASLGLPIPSSASLVGVTIYLQSLAATELTNALALTIGP
jgi:hypothetical protein